MKKRTMIGTTNAYATSLGLFFDTSFHFFPQKMLLGQACFVKGGNTYRLLHPYLFWIIYGEGHFRLYIC
jgi:hypothetical protein